LGLEVCGTGEGMVSVVEIGLAIGMVAVGDIGKSVLVLGMPVVRVLILWRDRWILDRDGW
jgi:hypothetical protein